MRPVWTALLVYLVAVVTVLGLQLAAVTALVGWRGSIEVERDAFQNSKGLRPAQPLRRLGKPAEVAELCVFLASEHAAYITGQCYLVNGGMYFL